MGEDVGTDDSGPAECQGEAKHLDARRDQVGALDVNKISW